MSAKPLAKVSVLVVGNYEPDQIQSMQRYSLSLMSIYQASCRPTLIKPPCLFMALPLKSPKILKFLGLVDKYLLFPLWLFSYSRAFDLVHIVDQCNAFYAFCLAGRRYIVTCHDLLLMRGALGDHPAAFSSSSSRGWLQRLNRAALQRAGAVVFVSRATLRDFQQLIGSPPRQRRAVIPNPLNAPFSPDPYAFPISSAEQHQLPDMPYLLMVGSSEPRKNRALALQLLDRLADSGAYRIVFAGAPLTTDEQSFRQSHPFGDRIVSIVRPSHALLNRLYCQAHALLFPSLFEGFGYPVIEAQTCHCPVIASTTTSIPEVAGQGALFADPTDLDTFADHVRSLEDPSTRSSLVALGCANARRYAQEQVAEAYSRLAFQLHGL